MSPTNSRAGIDEHPKTSSALHQPLVHQLLIALQDRERIHPVLSRHVAHGGQRIAFLEHAVEYHRDHPVAQLTVDRLIVVPLTVHKVFHVDLSRDTLVALRSFVELKLSG